MTPADHDLHTLPGAFVLDAVDDDERSAFVAHLSGCAACRDEIRELREAAGRLGTAEFVWPRPELRGETMRAAARFSQLAPAVPAAAGVADDAAPVPASGRRPRLGYRRAGALRSATIRRMPRLAAGALAVAMAGGVVFGVVMHETMRTLHHSQHQKQLISAVLGAPDAVMRTARVGSGGMARVVMSDREHMGVFTAYHLPALPATSHYELWLMGPLGNRRAGRLSVSKGGMAGPAVIRGMAAGDMIALTVEPSGGSTQPTSAPVVLIGP